MTSTATPIPADPKALDAALRASLREESREAYSAGLRLRAAKRKKTWSKLGFESWLAYLEDLEVPRTTAHELIQAVSWSRPMVEKHGRGKMAAFTTLARLAGYAPTSLEQLEACRVPVEGGEPVPFAAATVEQIQAASTILRSGEASPQPRESPRLRVKRALQACVRPLIRPNQVQVRNGPNGLRIRVRHVPADKAREVFQALARKVAELKAQGLSFAPRKEATP